MKAAQAIRALELEVRARDAGQARQPRRPRDVLLSSVDASDRVMQQLQQDLEAGRISAELVAGFGAWVERAGRLSKLALDAGVDVADDRASEQAAQVVVASIRRILDRLALTPDQEDLAGRVVPEVLRALAAEHAGPAEIEGEVIE